MWAFILISIARRKHLKRSFNVPNAFFIVICAPDHLLLKPFSWVFPRPENSAMINGSKGYEDSPNKKTGIESVSFHAVVLSLFKAFYWLKNSKNMEIMQASWPFYDCVSKGIFLVAHSLNVHGKMTLSVDIFCWYNLFSSAILLCLQWLKVLWVRDLKKLW